MSWTPNIARVRQATGHLRQRGADLLGDKSVLAALLVGGSAAFLVYMIGHGLAFATQLLLARTLGAESFGIYAYDFAWLTVLAYAATLGHNVAILRFIPTYIASESWPLLAGVIRYAELTTIAAALILITIGATVVICFGSMRPGEAGMTFLIGLPVVLLWPLVWLRSAMIRGFGGVAAALVAVRIVREGTLFTFALGLLIVVPWLSGPGLVMEGLVVASLLAFAAATRLLRHRQPAALSGIAPCYDAQTWNRAAMPLLVVVAVEALFDKAPILVLGILGKSQEAGIFALVFSIAMLVVLPRTALDTMFAPAIARLHAECKLEELRALVLRAAMLSSASAAIITLVLAIVSGPVLAWFGPEFERGIGALRILLLGQLLITITGSQLMMMAMTGSESDAARIMIGCTIANVLLCTLLAGTFGILGAATASAVMLVVSNAKMAIDIKRKLDLWPGLFAGIGTAKS